MHRVELEKFRVNVLHQQDDNSYVLVLEVKVVCTGHVWFLWLFDNCILETSERVSLETHFNPEKSQYTGVLRKKNIRWGSDSGLYQAKIINRHGATVVQKRICLYGCSPPQFVIAPRLVRHPEMAVFRLEYAVNNTYIGAFSVKWKKNGKPLDLKNEKYKAITKDLGKGICYVALQVNKANRGTDEGSYSSSLRNTSGSISANFTISLRRDSRPFQVDETEINYANHEDTDVDVKLRVHFVSYTSHYKVDWFVGRRRSEEPISESDVLDFQQITNYPTFESDSKNVDWSLYDALLKFKLSVLEKSFDYVFRCVVQNEHGYFFNDTVIVVKGPGEDVQPITSTPALKSLDELFLKKFLQRHLKLY